MHTSFNLRLLASLPALLLASIAPCGAQGFQIGRPYQNEIYTRIELHAGVTTLVDIRLLEARRELSDDGEGWETADRVTYDRNDFGFRGAHPDLGASVEMLWDFITLDADARHLTASSEATAQRHYFLGVGQPIEYEGRDYDVMMIPRGNDFSTAFEGGLLDLRVLFTPFGLVIDNYAWVTPAVIGGVFAVRGKYTLDAGEPRGVTFYQNPPGEYVIGGGGSWPMGVAVPQGGLGLDLRLGEPDCVAYVGQLQYTVFAASGDYPLASRDPREENASVRFNSIRLRNTVQFAPFANGTAFSAGLNLARVSTEGTSRTRPYDAPWDAGKQQRVSKDYRIGALEITGALGFTF
jgi:hypothetical protein